MSKMKNDSRILERGLIWLSASLLACALACAAPKNDGPVVVDSNTNWLKRCSKTAECGEQAQCICGLCTKACESDDACEVVGHGASCERTASGVAAERCESRGAKGVEAVCVVACHAEGVCRDDALSCVEGLCERSEGGAPMSMPDGAVIDASRDVSSDASSDASPPDADVADAAATPDAALDAGVQCVPGPCQNGGRCTQDGQSCACPVGISGATCGQIASVRQIVSGSSHVCALLGDNRVKCWGYNETGQLGLGDGLARGDEAGEMGASLPAVQLGTSEIVHSLSAGFGHSCALFVDGTVKCWGGNTSGELGLGDSDNRGDGPAEMGSNLPRVALGGAFVTQISAGQEHTCARFDDGRVACWGNNVNGQLGIDSTQNRGDQPGQMGANLRYVNLGGPARQVIASARYTCALLDDDTVKCWGDNGLGQLGREDSTPRGGNVGDMAALQAIPLGDVSSGITAIDSRGVHVCMHLGDGTIRCWGFGGVGQLGIGSTASIGDQAGEMGNNLDAADLGASAQMWVAGGVHNCALLSGNVLKCWGQNNVGQLGLGDTDNRADDAAELGASLPSVMLPAGSVTGLAAGEFHTCALLDDSDIYCFGDNVLGQLGRGNMDVIGDEAGEQMIPGPKVAL